MGRGGREDRGAFVRTGTGARGLCPSPPSHWAPGGRITTQQAAPPPSPLGFQLTPPPSGRTTPGAPAREAEGPCGRWAFSLGSCTATSSLPGSESHQTPRFKQRLLRTDGSARGEKREAAPLQDPRSPGASRRVPRLPGAQSPDFDRPGWRSRQAREEGERRAEGSSPGSRKEPPPPAGAGVPASRDRGTAAAARRLAPGAGFLGGGWGAWRFKIRPRWTPIAALLEGDDAPPRSPLGFLVSQSFSTRESIAESPSRNALGTLTTQPGLPPELRRAEVDTTRPRARPTAPGPTRPSLSLSPIPGPAPPGVGEQGRLGPLAKRYLGAVPRPASCRLSGAMGSETCEWVLCGGRCGRVSTLQPGPAPAKPPTAVWSFLTLVRELETL